MRLFHGTANEYEAPRVGGFDQIFWAADSSAVAQSYIPAASGSVMWHPLDVSHGERIWPIKSDVAYSVVVSHLGKEATDVVWDSCGRARSWIIPNGYPSYGDVDAYIREELGYGQGNLPVRLKVLRYDHQRNVQVFAPADHADRGWLWIVDGAEDLRIYDFVTGREGDLTAPDYHRLGLFRRLMEEGWDGIRIHDFTRSETWGDVGHESVGFFADALQKLRFTRIEAHHFDWPDYRTALVDVKDAPDYLDWLGRETHDPLLRKAATLRRGQTVVLSDAEYDQMVDRELYDLDVVSIPNPERVGILDAYLCGRRSAKKMQNALRKNLALQEKRAA